MLLWLLLDNSLIIGTMNDDTQTKKEQDAAAWSRAATTYGRVGPQFFAHFGSRLVDLTPIPTGASVLDVAAGRGAILFSAAEKVGRDGQVTGIDLSEGMVEETS